MARQKKVIDASVATKWFVQEADSDQALALRDEHVAGKIVLIAPELIFAEVLNVLRYKGKQQAALEEVNLALWDVQFHVEHTTSFLLRQAITLALKYNLTIYDALYAALAQIHGCPLITVDEKLSKVPQAMPL